jgi:hypothetical protein
MPLATHDPLMEVGDAPQRGAVVELDHRSSGCMDVSLFWNRLTNVVFVQVVDWHEGEDFCIPVEPARAGEAFRHPFAYASTDW